MSGIFGSWTNEMNFAGMSITTTQIIREDGSYETRMNYPLGGEGRQDIYHYGTAEIGQSSMRLRFHSGKTGGSGCADESKNFALRDFTSAEVDEAEALLDQDIAYTLEGDRLSMTVQSPAGPIEVVYTRQAE